MTEQEYIELLEQYKNDDTSALAKINLVDNFNKILKELNEYKESVTTLREQNVKLAMRITNSVVDEQQEVDPSQEILEKIKNFVNKGDE